MMKNNLPPPAQPPHRLKSIYQYYDKSKIKYQVHVLVNINSIVHLKC